MLTFVGFTAIVAEFAADTVVAVVFLLPLLLLFSWLLPLLSVHVVELAVAVVVEPVPEREPDSELVRGK